MVPSPHYLSTAPQFYDTFEAEWRISHFTDYIKLMKPGEKFSCKSFTTKDQPDIVKFQIQFYPNGKSRTECSLTSVIVLSFAPVVLPPPKNFSLHNLMIIATFSIKTVSGTGSFLPREVAIRNTRTELRRLKIPKWVSCKYLIDRAAEYLPNDTLTINVQGKVMSSMFALSALPGPPPAVPEIQKSNFEEFYLKKHLSDFMINSEGELLPVHKIVLAHKSPVFDAMFTHTSIESTKNVVVIDDVSKAAMKEMLYYMYMDDTSDNFKKVAIDVFKAADKYQVSGLKLECEKLLLRKMSIYNVIDIFLLGDTFQAPVLRKTALQFIKSNIKVISETTRSGELKQTSPIWSAFLDLHAL